MKNSKPFKREFKRGPKDTQFDKDKAPRKFGRDRQDNESSFGRDRPHKEYDPTRSPSKFVKPRLELFDAVCAKCGKDCQIPFKPRDNKRVLCRECFNSSDGDRSFTPRFEPRSFEHKSFEPRSFDSKPSQENEIQQINRKLDKIMRALKIE